VKLSSLNPPQRDAVTHTAGPLLVLAGAGSGKTRVITYRIAHLIRCGVEPEQVTALTFTNKAATEMRDRVARLLDRPSDAHKLSMGTFHSMGLHILKSERKALGFPRGFVIYDTADQLGVVRELLRRVRIGDRRFDVKAILTRISLAKNAFISPESYQLDENDEYDEITAELYPRYQSALRSFAAVDFDDLITETVRLFESNEDVRNRWRSRWTHVLVDEYQDTNRAQLMMVQTLVANHYNLCVVGDDDQSIYSWRGADPTNILEFERCFPRARVIVLEQNYRSTPTILAAANAVIKNNTDRRGKDLWSDKPPGQPITTVVAPDIEAEARFVAREIEQLRTDGQRNYSDFAVLYRSNTQTKILEEVFRINRLPYVMYGGQQFFERKEVKDIIAYLRLALNPRDEISLRRVINYPARGIGNTTVSRLNEWAEGRDCTLWAAVQNIERSGGELRPQERRAVESFLSVLEALRRSLASGVVAATTRLIQEIDLYGDIRSGSPSLTAAQHRIDHVDSLLRSLARHEKHHPGRHQLTEYLRQLSLSSNDEDEAEQAGDRVVLTTLHGAKGLEFPVVFLVGAEEELLPHARTLMPHSSDVVDDDLAADVSEERRLAYVGITRAKELLYITRAMARRRHGKMVQCTPSRFLMEIPPELVSARDVQLEAEQPVEAAELSSFFQSLGQSD